MIKIIFFILVCIVSSFASLNNASAIYPEYKDKPNGIYEDSLSNILFVIVEIPIDNSKRYKKDKYEAKAMLKFKDSLKDFLSIKKKNIDKTLIPFNGKLKEEIYKRALYIERFKFDIGNLKIKIFKNGKENENYRYIVAIDKNNLNLIKTNMDTVNSVEKATKDILHKSIDKPSLASIYFLNMNLYELAYVYKKMELSQSYNLINIFNIDKTKIYIYNDFFRKILNGNLDTSFLNYVPANKEILKNLYDSSDSKLEKKIFQNTSMFNSTKYFNKSIYELSILSSGHLEFDQLLSNEKTDEFTTAKKYFNEGVKINEIIRLLKISIQKAPRYFNNWYYMGSILKATGDLKNAEKCFIQALQLNPKNKDLLQDLSNIHNEYKLYLSILK